jgi:hypothetical protein
VPPTLSEVELHLQPNSARADLASDEPSQAHSVCGIPAGWRMHSPGPRTRDLVVWNPAHGPREVSLGTAAEHEVWESREAFEAFGAKLLPLLDEVGINPGEPQIWEVYKMDIPRSGG